MAWCPQCKNEYREGVKVCVDCGCELVEEEQFEDIVPLIFGEEQKLIQLKKFLEYNKLKGVSVSFDEADETYVLSVQKDDKGPAATMTRVFLQQEALREQEQAMQSADYQSEKEETETQQSAEGESSDATVQKRENSDIPTLYHNNSERAEENRSSAWMLMIVGGIGLLFMILGILGVIPLRLGNPYMFYGVMCAVFVLFIVMGVVSMKNAKIFEKKAESENTLRDAMTKWYKENLDAATIDAGLAEGEELPEEILYFKRVQKIKDLFNYQFMNLDQVFLEHYIDEEVYDYIFSDVIE